MDTSLSPIITVEELLLIKSRENLVIIDASNAKDAYAD
ncbi:sulfurtransferase, partial [Sphingobacterium haloxyli]